MTEYNPDCWVMLKMTYQEQVFYKVLAGWGGSYVNGSSWRLSSMIEKCEFDVAWDEWRFSGSSGSVYRCHPDGYGLRMSNGAAYEMMKKSHPDHVELLENCNWEERDLTK
jgi:hypothetical protein